MSEHPSTTEERADLPDPDAGFPEEDTHHPGPREYVKIAVALAFVTALEVLAYYVELGTFGFSMPHTALIFTLITLMVIKFALVVLWFMHLKFDSPLFRRMFMAGILLALSVFLVVLLIFGTGPVIGLTAVGFTLVLLFALMIWGARRAGA